MIEGLDLSRELKLEEIKKQIKSGGKCKAFLSEAQKKIRDPYAGYEGIYALWMEAGEEILLYIGQTGERPSSGQGMYERIKFHMNLNPDNTEMSTYLHEFGLKLKEEGIETKIYGYEEGNYIILPIAKQREFLAKYCFWRICPLFLDFFSKDKRQEIEKQLIEDLEPVFHEGGVFLESKRIELIREVLGEG